MAIVDGVPPGLALSADDLQIDLDRRKPGTSKYFYPAPRDPMKLRLSLVCLRVRRLVRLLGLLIRNTNQKSKDYGEIKDTFRPGHADYTYSMN